MVTVWVVEEVEGKDASFSSHFAREADALKFATAARRNPAWGVTEVVIWKQMKVRGDTVCVLLLRSDS